MTAAPRLSVVIATFNRGALLVRLLEQLAEQTLPRAEYEVVVVDDGSKEPAEQQTSARRWPFRLRVVRQENRGAAAARHNGATSASGEVILFIDDDMSVPPALLAEHLRLHDADPRAVVLGRIRRDPGTPMTLFERFHLRTLERLADGAREGRRTIRGVDVWTGNLSMRRAKYLEVGGFDFSLGHSEDAELGVRLEKSGARFRVSEEGYSLHSSDRTSLEGWMGRAFKYGVFDSRIGKKHADVPDTSPWRYFGVVNPVSRPFLAAALVAPGVSHRVAQAAIRVSQGIDALGMERLALAGATFAFGIEYARGLGTESGGAVGSLAEYLDFAGRRGSGPASGRTLVALRHLAEGLRGDHATLWRYRNKYREDEAKEPHLARDAVEKVGFQMMGAYRLMRFCSEAGVPLAPQVISRLMRHLYGSDIHWEARLEPGVVVIHGMGMAISDRARVKQGTILFQHVTLATATDSAGASGAPTIEEDVHIGPGATITGPVTIGARSKIMAGALVRDSVPPDSLVSVPEPMVTPRAGAQAARGAAVAGMPRTRRGSG